MPVLSLCLEKGKGQIGPFSFFWEPSLIAMGIPAMVWSGRNIEPVIFYFSFVPDVKKAFIFKYNK